MSERRSNSRLRRIGGFLFAGGLAFMVDAGLLTLGVEMFDLRAEVSRIFSFLAAVVTTWLINRSYTFSTSTAPTIGEFFRYLLAMGLGLAANYLVFVLTVSLSDIAREYPVIALVPATLAGMGLNYLTAGRILDR